MTVPPLSTISLGPLEDVLGFRLQRLRAALSGPILAEMKRWGLRRGAFMVLALVKENPGLSQTALGRETGIRKTLLVALLHELEDRALLERKVLASDRRHNQLFVTAAGAAIVTDMVEVVRQVEAPIRDAMPAAEYARLKSVLDQALRLLGGAGQDEAS